MNIRKRTWEILTNGKSGDTTAKAFNAFIVILILLNIVAFILQSEKTIDEMYETEFFWFEAISVSIFTIEYLARLYSCRINPAYRGTRGLVRFIFTPMALVDLLAILPFYLPFTGIDMRVIRVLRVFRIFRIFKMGRYYSSLNIMKNVIVRKKEELVLTSVIMVALLLISSTLIYYAEREAQPEAFSSIPQAMWWGTITLTTVGYGDVSPITPLGKFFGSLIAIFGVGMFALPVSILGAGFIEEIETRKAKIDKPDYCPHCGKEL